jgi:hypothetical protein
MSALRPKKPAPKPTQPTPEMVAAQLSLPQRLLLFCVASNSDWRKAGITNATVQLSIVKNLIDRDETTAHLELTEHGRAVLAALRSGADVMK